MDQYELWDKVHDGHVYMKIVKGVYGIPQTGILEYKQLVNHLKPYGYEPWKFTQGLCTHRTNGITFTLCVDDFGIKYTYRANALHLLDALKKNTQFQRTGREKSIVVWPSIGTINNEQSQSPSQIMFQNISTNSNIKCRNKQKIPHTPLQEYNTARKLNTSTNKNNRQSYLQRTKQKFKNFLEPFYSMREKLMIPRWRH